MRPKDIVVGQHYRHEDLPGAIFVGTAIGSNFSETKSKKFLYVLKAQDGGQGFLVIPPEMNNNANMTKEMTYKFWSKFHPI